jgi:hypothetical protein
VPPARLPDGSPPDNTSPGGTSPGDTSPDGTGATGASRARTGPARTNTTGTAPARTGTTGLEGAGPRREAAPVRQAEQVVADARPPRPPRSTVASGRIAESGPVRRGTQLVERTVLVRLIPRTGVFGRVRAVVALAVIAITFGLLLAGGLSLAVWGLAVAIHHAANN